MEESATLTLEEVTDSYTHPTGDGNADGTVCITDAQALAHSIGKSLGDFGFRARFDLDLDGAVTASDAALYETDYLPLTCLSDLDCNGEASLDDIVAFVNAFSDGSLVADITAVGGPPQMPDGQLTIDDILSFVNSFSDGCPN